MQAKRVNC